MRKHFFLSLMAICVSSFLIWSCQKEMSYEKGATVFMGIVKGTAGFSLSDCGATVIAGTYTKGTALTAANTVTLTVNVDTIGSWAIAAGPLGGMTFSGSGDFTATGKNTITLNATGTPSAAGTYTVSITSKGSTCSFDVTVADNSGGGTGGGGNTTTGDNTWIFTEGGKTYSGTFSGSQLEQQSAGGLTAAVLSASGNTASGDSSLAFEIIDISGSIQNNESYLSTIGNNNFITGFSFDNKNTLATIYEGGIPVTGTSLVMKVTSHNTSTKKMEGTFSGTVKDGNGTVKTISGGQFKLTYK